MSIGSEARGGTKAEPGDGSRVLSNLRRFCGSGCAVGGAEPCGCSPLVLGWSAGAVMSDLTRRSNTSANARCRRRRRRPLQAANVSACGGAALRRPGCRVNVTWSRHLHLSRARLTSMHATRVCKHASTRPDPAGRGTAGRGRPGGTSGRAAASGYVRMRG